MAISPDHGRGTAAALIKTLAFIPRTIVIHDLKSGKVTNVLIRITNKPLSRIDEITIRQLYSAAFHSLLRPLGTLSPHRSTQLQSPCSIIDFGE